MRVFQLVGPLLMAAVLQSRGSLADTIVNSVGDDGSSLSCSSSNSSSLDDATSSSSSSCTTSNENTPFEIPPNSSITDFLSPHILHNPSTLASIKRNLMAGKLIVLRNAFKAEFAEHVWSQLASSENKWERGQYFHTSGSAYISLKPLEKENNPTSNNNSTTLEGMIQKIKTEGKKTRYQNRHKKFEPDNDGHNTRKKELKYLHHREEAMVQIVQVFNNTATRKFMNTISERSCSGKTVFLPTEYGRGDYSAPHTDFRDLRSVDFVWNLSKEWEPEWGGAFYWANAKTIQEGTFHSTFNTLILFLPTMISSHYVTPIRHFAQGRRLSFNGKFHANLGDVIDNIPQNETLESIYGKKQEDHIRLTTDDALWIAHDLDIEKYTEDEERRRKLRELGKSLNETYLYVEDEGAFVVSWDEEDEEEEDNNDEGKEDVGEETKEEDASSEMIDVSEKSDIQNISITSQSSITDFLDPSILEDTELLSEIRTNLRKGKLVVIREAFTPEFAEYAWRQMDRDDLVWESSNEDDDDDAQSMMDRPIGPVKSSQSPELNSVLDLFQHDKTVKFLESITGCSCGGKERSANVGWFKEGSSYPVQSGHKNLDTVNLVWDLAKDWDPTYGGSFYWFPSLTLNGGYNQRTFNTLMLFLPTPSSIHAVTPVAWWAESKLFNIHAKYSSTGKEFQSAVENGSLEERFAKEEDYIDLTEAHAKWIVHTMKVDEMAKGDPVRRERLLELKENVATKYLYPRSDMTFVVESDVVEESF